MASMPMQGISTVAFLSTSMQTLNALKLSKSLLQCGSSGTLQCWPYLVAMKVRARLMKLPRLARSSELFLAVRSDHLKSVSEVSGLLLSRKYRHTCSSHTALSVHIGRKLPLHHSPETVTVLLSP